MDALRRENRPARNKQRKNLYPYRTRKGDLSPVPLPRTIKPEPEAPFLTSPAPSFLDTGEMLSYHFRWLSESLRSIHASPLRVQQPVKSCRPNLCWISKRRASEKHGALFVSSGLVRLVWCVFQKPPQSKGSNQARCQGCFVNYFCSNYC